VEARFANVKILNAAAASWIWITLCAGKTGAISSRAFLSILLVSCIASPVQSGPAVPYRFQISYDVRQDAPTIFVNQIGEGENRETFASHFSKNELTKEETIMRYSGEVEWTCENSEGEVVSKASGAIIKRSGSNALLRIDAHHFFRREGSRCLGPVNGGDYRQCFVQKINWDGTVSTKHRYKIDVSTLQIGDYCRSEDQAAPNSEDWAVVELEEAIPGIVPFRLGASKEQKMFEEGDREIKITVISAGQTGFLSGEEPSICEGYIGYVGKEMTRSGRPTYYHTNSCSTEGGGSGSAVVIVHPGEPSEIVGMVNASADKKHAGLPYGPKNFTRGAYFSDDAAMEAIRSCDVRCPKIRRPNSN
jgi:hypothetical protein